MPSINGSVMHFNSSVNNTETINNNNESTKETDLKIALIISWIELVLIVILNSLLIILLLKRKPKSRMAFFVLHLSLSDFCYIFCLCSVICTINYTIGNIDSSDKQISGRSNIMTRSKIRSVQMAFLVVTVYFLSWSPLMINILFTVHGVIHPGSYYYILMALAPLNSAANPIAFIIFNHNMILSPNKKDNSCPSVATATTYLLQQKPKSSSQ
ncbi:hypothetical protein KUTeg_001857 [Tegillarca granosa]|uniref:G-protein coupled receptors family 1 profile domain-containing protein n=1 Tax=Tegillarca granosa TaxID=220873 RepID=A0ABQ9FSR3_TEGGR|nr:hypothetical protein KUTeg_001857 [Tegillarca granosa]